MGFLFTLLMKRRVLGWKETLRREVFGVVKTLNGIWLQVLMGFFWGGFFKHVGRFLKRI
jgi:hypothetical protein